MKLHFMEDLTWQEQTDPRETHHRMQQELRTLAEFRILQICRYLFLVFSLVLGCVISIGQYHVPVPIYGLLAYFLVYLILSEFMKKYKTQEFLLQSLRLRYHYQYDKLLTERFSFCLSFILLAAIQYAFLNTIQLNHLMLTYAPAGFAVLQLLFRYLGAWALYIRLHRSVRYRR